MSEGNLSWWMKVKPKIWSLFDEPHSSFLAKVVIHCQDFFQKSIFVGFKLCINLLHLHFHLIILPEHCTGLENSKNI